MKLEDHIQRSIIDYPGLFLKKTYEDSQLSVLHHLVLVNGNGVEWANTLNPKHGGYLTSPQYRRYKGERVRKRDAPYGKIKVEKLSWQELYDKGVEKERNTWIEYVNKQDYSDKLKKIIIEDALQNFPKDIRESPYPIYDRGWPIYDIEQGIIKVKDIKPDWREGILKIIKWAHNFYTNKDLFHNDDYYGSNPESLKQHIEQRYPQNSWADILTAYGVNDIPEQDYTSFAITKTEKSRMEYVNLTERAINLLQ